MHSIKPPVTKPASINKPMLTADATKQASLKQTLTRIVVKENLRQNEQLIYFSC